MTRQPVIPGLGRMPRAKGRDDDVSALMAEEGIESRLEARLLLAMRRAGVPEPLRQYRFCPERLWRLDFAWPDIGLAVEVDGGVFIRGRHQRPMGFLKDAERARYLSQRGWTLLRYTTADVGKAQTVAEILAVISRRMAGR